MTRKNTVEIIESIEFKLDRLAEIVKEIKDVLNSVCYEPDKCCKREYYCSFCGKYTKEEALGRIEKLIDRIL